MFVKQYRCRASFSNTTCDWSIASCKPFKFNATIHQQYSITRPFLAAQSRLILLEFYSLQYLSVDGGGGMPGVEEVGGGVVWWYVLCVGLCFRGGHECVSFRCLRFNDMATYNEGTGTCIQNERTCIKKKTCLLEKTYTQKKQE